MFQVNIELTSDLMEYYGTVDFSKEENLGKFETALEDAVKEKAEKTLDKLKNELKTDVLQFDTHLRIHHNKLWKEIKSDWDAGENYFSQIYVSFDVSAIITEPGTSIKVNTEGDE